jgi:prevent-host-death family protein
MSKLIGMMIDHRDVVGVTELANSSSRLVASAQQGHDVIIAKNSRVVAALVGIDRFQELEDREENLALLTLALTRVATDNGNRTDLDDFIAELGMTDEVGALDDDEDEGA